jgi:hypothetical protein
MSNEFMRRAKEVGFQKFTDIGLGAFKIIEKSNKVREDINVFILSHSEVKNGVSKLKTIGEMTDKTIVMEGRCTIVLHTLVEDNKYKFVTQNNGYFLAKSPMGMFEENIIDNDLKYVSEKINQYYNDDGANDLDEIEEQKQAA